MKITFFDSHTLEREFLIQASQHQHELNFLKLQLSLKNS